MLSFNRRFYNTRALCSMLSAAFVLSGLCLNVAPARAGSGEDVTSHVYMVEPNGPLDVTGTLYTLKGQTYAIVNGVSIAIVLNTVNNTVANLSGAVVGYITPAKQQVAKLS